MDARWARVLLAHLNSVVIDAVEQSGGGICIKARTTPEQAVCPDCDTASRRVHSRYERCISDGAIGGRAVEIRLMVRRFRCAAASCGRVTFAEQVPGLTFRHGRRSSGTQVLLRAIAHQLAGRAGARLAEQLGTVASRSTLLRLIRATVSSEAVTPCVLGVDDFALRKGHVYGTVLIDVETRRPVDLLPSREADALAAWLRTHPGVQVICRDRASGYAEGGRLGAPDAIHVADRWHVWRNLVEAVERVVARNAAHLREPAPAPPDPAEFVVPKQREDTPARLAARIRQRHAAVHTLLAEGRGVKQIAAQLHLARNTVRRYARANTPEALMIGQWQAGRPRLLDPFQPYLLRRLAEGQSNAARLYEELTALGYRGSPSNLREYLRPLCVGVRPRRRTPSVRTVTGWITRHPDRLAGPEREQLAAILGRCSDLAATARHVRTFAVMMRERAGRRLNTWAREVREDALPELHSFVFGIEQDYDAVLAALTQPYSSGVVEGHVNRIKMLKRQMYGRANFDLLRARVLQAA